MLAGSAGGSVLPLALSWPSLFLVVPWRALSPREGIRCVCCEWVGKSLHIVRRTRVDLSLFLGDYTMPTRGPGEDRAPGR